MFVARDPMLVCTLSHASLHPRPNTPLCSVGVGVLASVPPPPRLPSPVPWLTCSNVPSPVTTPTHACTATRCALLQHQRLLSEASAEGGRGHEHQNEEADAIPSPRQP